MMSMNVFWSLFCARYAFLSGFLYTFRFHHLPLLCDDSYLSLTLLLPFFLILADFLLSYTLASACAHVCPSHISPHTFYTHTFILTHLFSILAHEYSHISHSAMYPHTYTHTPTVSTVSYPKQNPPIPPSLYTLFLSFLPCQKPKACILPIYTLMF